MTKATVVAAIIIKAAVLTPDGSDSYSFSADANGEITATAPASNQGTNLRQVFWIHGAPDFVDGTSCATWTTETSSLLQEGAALRIVEGDGFTRAVTVTKNIYFGATWIINLHVWDSRESPAYSQVGQFDLSDELAPSGERAPFPWRLCARVVGSTLEFKIWRPNDERKPAWGDSSHGGSATVPAGWVQPGEAGLFVGHIPPGGAASFDRIKTFAMS